MNCIDMLKNINKSYMAKCFTTRMFKKEKNWISCSTYIKYNPKNGNVYISPLFRCGRKTARLRCFNLKQRNKSIPKTKIFTDEEMRNEIEKIIREKPTISSKEIEVKTGFSCYRVNRLYMSVKRRLL